MITRFIQFEQIVKNFRLPISLMLHLWTMSPNLPKCENSNLIFFLPFLGKILQPIWTSVILGLFLLKKSSWLVLKSASTDGPQSDINELGNKKFVRTWSR